MTLRIALFGYGGVASIHAQGLVKQEGIEVTTVYGPDCNKAAEFSSKFAIGRCTDNMEEALSMADAAVICSPSKLHFEQAQHCLEAGLHALVEMPPCESAVDAEKLWNLATKQGVVLQGAHTARYLLPHARLTDYIRSGLLDTIREVNFIRHHRLLRRSWTDDALLHHAAHPIDLFLYWFGALAPLSCIALPQVRDAETVSLLAKLPNGAPAAVAITYASRLPRTQLLVVGSSHTVETDGFSFINSDLVDLNFRGDGQQIYETAIHIQDTAFIEACRGKQTGTHWQDSIKLLRTIDQLRSLAAGTTGRIENVENDQLTHEGCSTVESEYPS